MFEEMWKEIKDLEGEIFDICHLTGMLLLPSEKSLTDEEIEQMYIVMSNKID